MVYIENAISTIRTDYFAFPVAVVTDASGECRKARRVLALKYPDMMFLDCYAHQVNLVVGDYFKSQASVLEFADSATELISWLRSKTQILALLREIQAKYGEDAVKAVIRAVLTRWTAHYQAYARLLDLHVLLVMLVDMDSRRVETEQCVIAGDAKAKKKAKVMVALIRNNTFWTSLLRYVNHSQLHVYIFDSWISRMKRHLEPLAIAANVTQAAFCRLDTVVLTFGFLVMRYQRMTEEGDRAASMSIIASLEKRWAAADQDIFVAAVIVNPFFQAAPFFDHPRFVVSGIIELLGRLYARFFQEEPPETFSTELRDYLTARGQYSELRATCRRHTTSAKQQVCFAFTPSPTGN